LIESFENYDIAHAPLRVADLGQTDFQLLVDVRRFRIVTDPEPVADIGLSARIVDKIRRVILCSGKVYYDLYEEREKRAIDDVYLLRVEQLYPFPLKSLVKELARFKKAELVWCQEEPKNMGAWSFVEPYLEWVLGQAGGKAKRARYAGRPAAAAPATGLMSKHLAQLKTFLDKWYCQFNRSQCYFKF